MIGKNCSVFFCFYCLKIGTFQIITYVYIVNNSLFICKSVKRGFKFLTLADSLMLWNVLWARFGEKYLNVKTFNPSIEDGKKVRTHTLKDAMILIHNNYKLGKDGKELLDLANEIMADFYSSKVELKYGVLEFLEHC